MQIATTVHDPGGKYYKLTKKLSNQISNLDLNIAYTKTTSIENVLASPKASHSVLLIGGKAAIVQT